MIDETGNEYGYWTVVKYSFTKNNIAYWVCKCRCGNIKVVNMQSLRSGKSKSCGCGAIRFNRDTRKLIPGQAACKALYYTYQKNAKNRGLDFSLSVEAFNKLTKQNCFYCGKTPGQIYMNKKSRMYGEYIYNGIDRIDNNLGYVDNNVVASCICCNRMKWTMDKSNFVEQIKKIFHYINKTP